MQPDSHLSLQVFDLHAAAEWSMAPARWCMVRLSEGIAYCFDARRAYQMNVADIIVVPPGGSALFRASQLGSARLHYFHFEPQLLRALLTLSEQQCLSVLADTTVKQLRYVPATESLARQFTALCEASAGENLLLARCQMLELVARLFAAKLQATPQPPGRPASALARFHELIQTMPEADLLNHAPAELARLCGCSLRHFTRLFHAHFGASVRAKHTELRLDKARQLLRDTDEKITDVALDSGFQHIGLFNAMFKQRFGVTPGEFRRSRNKQP